MDVRIRTSEWEPDGELKRELSKYVIKGLQRNEILSYMLRDFPKFWMEGCGISISFTIATTFL